MYRLVRILPSGQEKVSEPAKRIRDAAAGIAHVLHYNTGLSRAEASRFAARMEREALGFTGVHAASGYKFRIERVDA